MYTATRMNNVPFSSIRKVFEEVNKVEKRGIPIIHLEIGRPDFDTPTHIKKAAFKALNDGKIFYTSNYGLPELRKAIAHKFITDNKLDYNPETEIVVTAGVSEAITLAMMAFINPGEEVLVFEPVFPAYINAIRMANGVPVIVPCFMKNRYQPQMKDIEQKITPKTKMIIFSTPGNPSGVIYTHKTLKGIAHIAQKNNLLVFSDEIYEKIIYDNHTHISIGSLPNMRDRTITANGFSKAYAMTGWRLGYLAASEHLISAIIRIHQNAVVCASSISQWAGVAALNQSQNSVDYMVKQFARRRSLVVNQLSKIKDISFVTPQGAIYVYINGSKISSNAYQLASELLHEANVSVVPWNNTHIRISFGNSYENLEVAMERLSNFFQKKFNKSLLTI